MAMGEGINICSMKINLSDKIIAWLALLSGLTISAVAIWYSVAGLVSIFSAAVIPIIVMGVALEISKLIATVWLKLNWNRAPIFIRAYLLASIAILMLITSMGIFGFLSKAHSDQSLVSGDVQSKIAIYDEKIKVAKDNIDANRKALKQMDEAVDQIMGRSQDEKGADKAVALRRGQTKERTRLLSDIAAEQKTIAKLSEERAPIAAEVRKVEAEVGPIKYIAQVIYGDADTDLLEKAVRFVTILIVLVFDPLAVLMLVAANWQLKKDKGTIEPEPVKEKVWDKFFKKEPANDFPEKEPEIKHIVIEDNIEFKDVFNPKEQDSELPEIKVDEHNKDWEPELFDRKQVKKIEYDSAGRRITPITEEEFNPPTKTQSFLNKVQEVFSSPSVKTIEKEVEELQKK